MITRGHLRQNATHYETTHRQEQLEDLNHPLGGLEIKSSTRERPSYVTIQNQKKNPWLI
jgi:hypothetical protein